MGATMESTSLPVPFRRAVHSHKHACFRVGLSELTTDGHDAALGL